ncbi:MAG: hydrogenase 3 maturation endopeptidase HyCI [bacterium]
MLVGVGNPLRQDDGAGPYLIELLQDKTTAALVDAKDVPENYLEAIAGHDPANIIIVDAALMDEKPGVYKLIPDELIPDTSMSTHQISLKVFVEILRNFTKAKIFVIGVQPKEGEYGECLSPEVKAGVEELARELEEELCMN